MAKPSLNLRLLRIHRVPSQFTACNLCKQHAMPRPNAPPQKRKRVEPEPEEEPSDSIEEESDDEQPEQGTGFKRVDAFRRQPVPGRGAGDGSDASDDGGSGAEDDDEDDSEGEGKPGDDGSEGESGEGADEDDDDDDGRTLEDQVGGARAWRGLIVWTAGGRTASYSSGAHIHAFWSRDSLERRLGMAVRTALRLVAAPRTPCCAKQCHAMPPPYTAAPRLRRPSAAQ